MLNNTTLMLWGRTTAEIEAAERAHDEAEARFNDAVARFEDKYPPSKYPVGHPRTLRLLEDDEDVSRAYEAMEDAWAEVLALRNQLRRSM